MRTDVRGRTVYQFCVVCPGAEQVYLMGNFNGWSTSATPMRNTEEHVWQLSIELPDGASEAAAAAAAAAAATPRFSYFVIDKRRGTGRAPFGGTYLLPGTWAAVVETPAVEADRYRDATADVMPPPLSN
jgi:hypothetical protein